MYSCISIFPTYARQCWAVILLPIEETKHNVAQRNVLNCHNQYYIEDVTARRWGFVLGKNDVWKYLYIIFKVFPPVFQAWNSTVVSLLNRNIKNKLRFLLICAFSGGTKEHQSFLLFFRLVQREIFWWHLTFIFIFYSLIKFEMHVCLFVQLILHVCLCV